MKTLLFCLIFVLGTFFPAVGQDAGQNSEILVVSQDKFLRFHGHAGRTYFIQASDPLSHLRQWLWMPVIETGNDSDISYEVGGTDPKGFFRLVYSDVPKPAGVSLEDWDLDGDGLSNWDEITLHGTYPDKPDTDGDGMTDGWEVTHDLDPQNPNDAFDDPDGDGTDNREEHDQQTDPGNQADFPTQIWSVTAAASGSSSVWTSEIKKHTRKRNWNESTYSEPQEGSGHLAVAELKALVEGLTLPETLAEAKAEPDYIHYNESGASAHGHFHQSASSSEARQGNHTVTRVWVRMPAKAEQQTRQFIKVTSRNHPDADTVVESGTVTVTVPANQTESEYVDLTCDNIMVSGKDVITDVELLPVELYSDLNNDGQLTSADSGLVGKAYASGVSEDEKDKGTEFMFANDQLSNGAWDKEDSTTPGKPAGTDDDDAEELHINPGITEGEVWLDHPAITGLKFYRDKKCTQQINISTSSHFDLTPDNPFPDKVFMRAESVNFTDTSNPQVEGDLKLIIKPDGGDANGIEATKMRLTVIKDLGSQKYFHGVRDYIFENNTKTFTHHKNYGTSTRYRIVAMREESTEMFGLDTYDHVSDEPRLKGINAVKDNYFSDVIINGNQCFFSGAYFFGSMTDRCDGRLCVGRQILRPPSDDTHNPNLGGPGARYVGNSMGEPEIVDGVLAIPSHFTFATGQVPEGVPATSDHGIGGLAAKYDRAELQQSENQAIGRAFVTDPGKGVVFTATTYVGNPGKAISLAADAHRSGVQPLSGGAAGTWELLFLDGSSSVGLVLASPNGDQQIVIKGSKHDGNFYYINTYLLFECKRPRN